MKKKMVCRKRRGGLAYASVGTGNLLMIFIDRFALETYMNIYKDTRITILDKYKDSKHIAHAITINRFVPVIKTQNLIMIRCEKTNVTDNFMAATFFDTRLVT